MRTVYPLGTTVCKPEKCCNGYTLINGYRRSGLKTGSGCDPWSHARSFQTSHGEQTDAQSDAVQGDSQGHLLDVIDMNGRIVHGWDVDVARIPQLLDNGHIVSISRSGSDPVLLELQFGALSSRLRGHAYEYDWNGQVVWDCPSPVPEDLWSSQAVRLPNGNTLFWYVMPMPDRFRQQIKDPIRRNMDGIVSGCICEVTPDKEVVWNWHCHDHLDLNGYCHNDPNPNWVHPNTIQALPGNRHYDAGDARFKPGNVLASGRSLGFIFIIDKESGEIVWRYQGQWKGGLAGQHSPQMVEKSLPGEGNIIVFDNGQSPLRFDRHGGMTAILEIDPAQAKEVWIYENEYLFFSAYGGHCQRLSNGNTLITESLTCRAFEITLEGEVVWEHVRDPGTWMQMMDATRIPYDHCPQLKSMKKPTEQEVIPPPHINTNPKPISPCQHHQIKKG